MNQRDRLLAFLQSRKTIDPLQSWSLLGIYRLSARVLDLRNLGYHIETETAEVINKYNEKCRVARYRLVEAQGEMF